MFPEKLNPRAEATATLPRHSASIKHPVAALALTIVLAFLVAIGISAFVSTTDAGEFCSMGRKYLEWISFAIESASHCVTGDFPRRLYEYASAVIRKIGTQYARNFVELPYFTLTYFLSLCADVRRIDCPLSIRNNSRRAGNSAHIAWARIRVQGIKAVSEPSLALQIVMPLV